MHTSQVECTQILPYCQSLAELAGFSFVTYSFCFKLLWAPVVDCIYSARFGKRKTWLIPTQYSIGILMLYMSLNMKDWLGDGTEERKPKLREITMAFFCCNFMAATQDVSVDGWSLTMLKRRNIGHASTCNNIGLALGQFFGYVLFIILDSKDICNKFRAIPQPYGFMSFADFMLLWAIIFIASTTMILMFKKDRSLAVIADVSELRLGVKESYKHLWRVLKIRPIQMVCLLLLTCRIGSGPVSGVAPLKLVDIGVPTDQLALLAIPLLPFQAVLPFILSQKMTGPRSMHCFMVTLVYKIVLGISFAVALHCRFFIEEDTKLPAWYFGILLLLYALDQMTSYFMWVTAQAFYSRISDPRFGGMYLTLLNAMSNLGDRWPVSLCLWLVDWLTWRRPETCNPVESSCTFVDGFYIEILFSSVLAGAWLWWSKRYIIKLENLDQSSWVVKKKLSSAKGELLLNHRNVASICSKANM